MKKCNLSIENTQELSFEHSKKVTGGEYAPMDHAGYYWSSALGLGGLYVIAYTIGYFN